MQVQHRVDAQTYAKLRHRSYVDRYLDSCRSSQRNSATCKADRVDRTSKRRGLCLISTRGPWRRWHVCFLGKSNANLPNDKAKGRWGRWVVTTETDLK